MSYTSQWTGAQIDSAIGTIVQGYFRSYKITSWVGVAAPYSYTTSDQSIESENEVTETVKDYPYSKDTFYKVYFVEDDDDKIFDVDYEIVNDETIQDKKHMKVYSNTNISGTLYVSVMR